MAGFNELLAARYNQLVSDLLALGEQHGVRSVAPEVMPVLSIEQDVDARPEHSFPKSERLWHAYSSRALDAGNFSMVYVQNPAGSGMISVVKCIVIGSTAAGTLSHGPSNNPPAGVAGLCNVRDTRWFVSSGSLNPATRCWNAVSAANQGTINVRIPASDFRILPVNYVLNPGFSYVISGTAINTALDGVSFYGYERAATPEELATT